MAYRNPRFCVLHAARLAGAASITGSVGTPDSTTTIEALRDLRAGRLYRITPASSIVNLDLDRGASAVDRTPIDRLIIPAGHNLATVNGRLRLEETTGGTAIDDADGVAFERTNPGAHTLAYDLTATREQELTLEVLDQASAVELGELVFTRILQPTTGVVPDFDPGRWTRQGADVETIGGQVYTFDLGAARRSFTFQHRRVSGSDLALYQYVWDTARINGNRLWFDHPDSGDVDTIVQACNSVGAWSISGGSGSLVAGYDGTASEALRLTATSTPQCSAFHTFASPLDLRGKYVYVDVKPGQDWFAGGANSLQVVLRTNASNQTIYQLGSILDAKTTPNGNWWRLCIQNAGAAFGSTGPVDLANVATLGVSMDNHAATNTLDIDNVRVIDPLKLPICCEIARMTWRQDSPAPLSASGPTYRIDADLREVTA